MTATQKLNAIKAILADEKLHPEIRLAYIETLCKQPLDQSATVAA
jgi:hypothetical protein